MMRSETPSAIETEYGFLRQLLGRFLPGRIGGLLRSPSATRGKQLVAFVVFMGAVVTGYGYGLVSGLR